MSTRPEGRIWRSVRRWGASSSTSASLPASGFEEGMSVRFLVFAGTSDASEGLTESIEGATRRERGRSTRRPSSRDSRDSTLCFLTFTSRLHNSISSLVGSYSTTATAHSTAQLSFVCLLAHRSARVQGEAPPVHKAPARRPASLTFAMIQESALLDALPPMPPQLRNARETSSSPQLRAGLLSLPVELVEHILTLSLPDNEEERPAHLALVSLVHTSWKAFAESLLYRRIVLRSPAAARKLCLTFAASRDGKRLAQMCRVMLLNPAAPDGEYKLKIADEMRVVELLKAVTEMEELEVHHMMTIDVWEFIRCPSEFHISHISTELAGASKLTTSAIPS